MCCAEQSQSVCGGEMKGEKQKVGVWPKIFGVEIKKRGFGRKSQKQKKFFMSHQGPKFSFSNLERDVK